jgi:hypothetical protein
MVMNLESFGVDGVGYDETETQGRPSFDKPAVKIMFQVTQIVRKLVTHRRGPITPQLTGRWRGHRYLRARHCLSGPSRDHLRLGGRSPNTPSGIPSPWRWAAQAAGADAGSSGTAPWLPWSSSSFNGRGSEIDNTGSRFADGPPLVWGGPVNPGSHYKCPVGCPLPPY